MTAVRIVPYYTTAERDKWEDPWELIEGMPFAMSPAPMPKHQRVAGLLFWEFERQLRDACKPCKAYLAIDWKVAEDTVFIPDLLVTCLPAGKTNLQTPPELIVEILSPSTAVKDRNTKFAWYQQQKVRYYLMIDIESEVVEIFELVNDEYAAKPPVLEASFTFSTGCSVLIRFTDIWD